MPQLYKDFQPTGFDPKGSHLPDRQDWLVVPVSRTRDSGCLAKSNFVTALEILGDESDTVEVHRFGHWGPGWFEIIIADPSLLKEVEEIEASLEDYPILDEEDLSEREHEASIEDWDSYGRDSFKEALSEIYDEEILEDLDLDEIWQEVREHLNYEYESLDEGTHFNIKGAIEYIEKHFILDDMLLAMYGYGPCKNQLNLEFK